MDYCLHPCQITNVTEVHDYWQVTTDRYTMNIFNRFFLENKLQGRFYDLNIINHCKIVNSNAHDDKLILSLDNGCELVVSLSDEDYTGPEALQIIYVTGNIVVF